MAKANHDLRATPGDKGKVNAAKKKMTTAEEKIKAAQEGKAQYSSTRSSKKALESPAHKEAEGLRMKVNDKNLHFTYSWKALNQVHIVGERKKSPAGAALPEEVLQFNKLAILKDEQLRKARPAKTREWKLIRQ